MSAPGSVMSAAVGLRCWARGHEPHVAAAARLLIAHEVWLARTGFRAEWIERDPDGTCWIDWPDARGAFDAGRFNTASSSELAVLDLAIAIGEDRYRFSRIDAANGQAIVNAVAAALGVVR